ncbi:rhodanese-like domain-containing protein [bacterium]|nr:rhodanese-like domain-containing protein [bacterium]
MSQPIPEVQTNEVLQLIKEGYEIIDVRESEEYVGELGHISGSLLVTLGKQLENFLEKEDKSKKLIFVCRSGGRSGRATELALRMGFKEVLNMSGGMIKWNEDGCEVEK